MRDSPFCPGCHRTVAIMEIHCPYCGRELASAPFGGASIIVGALFGAVDGVLYALWEMQKPKPTFHGGLVGGGILGAILGMFVLGGITFVVSKAILSLRHARARDFLVGDENTAEWQALSRASGCENAVVSVFVCLLVHGLAFAVYWFWIR